MLIKINMLYKPLQNEKVLLEIIIYLWLKKMKPASAFEQLKYKQNYFRWFQVKIRLKKKALKW